MKRIINTSIILLVSLLCLIFLSGCNKGDNNIVAEDVNSNIQTTETENKTDEPINENLDFDTYTITSGKAEATFKIAKDLNYTPNKTSTSMKIHLGNTLDLSSIIFTIFYSNPENALKSAEDFPEAEGYYDYNNITIGKYNGYEVYKKENLGESYQGELILTESTPENPKVVSVSFNVIPFQFSKDTGFETRPLVTSDAFKNILESFVANINK